MESIVFLEPLWDALRWAPHVLAVAGGILIGVALAGTRGWEPTCRRCRHDLRGARDPRCPECGSDLDRPKAVQTGRWRLRVTPLVLGLVVVAASLLPSFGFRTSDLREALARRVPPGPIVERAIAGDDLAGRVHRERLANRDQAQLDAVVAEAVRHVREDTLGGRNDVVLRALPGRTSVTGADDPLVPVYRALAERAGRSEADAAAAAQAMAATTMDESETGRRIALASDALVRAMIALSGPTAGMRGEPIGLRPQWTGLKLFVAPVDPRIAALRWRRSPADAWTEVALPAVRDSDARFQRLPAIDAEGEVEVEVEASLDLPANVEGSGAAARTVVARLRSPYTLRSRAELVATPLRPEGREAVEANLRSIRLRRFASSVQATFGLLPGARAQRGSREEPVYYGGAFVLRYDGKDHPLGTYCYSTRGGGGGSGGGDDGLDGVQFEPGKPLVLRIAPDLAVIRARVQGDFEYVSEILELEFDGLEQPPREIRWLAPPAPGG